MEVSGPDVEVVGAEVVEIEGGQSQFLIFG